MFKHLDHIAIVVRDTDEALKFYRDILGLPLRLSEVIEEAGVRLTHLDLGNLDLQLVQPLRPDHPLAQFLNERGEGLHHLCCRVENLGHAIEHLPERHLQPRQPQPHRGPLGRRAIFLDPNTTRGVLWELTAEK